MLKLNSVSKTYPMDHRGISALRDISLEVAEGEFTALMGPSGSGKSTLLHIMGGLDQPTSGSVFFHNKNLATMNDAELSRFRNEHIGFVFQDALLLPHLTLLENVAIPLLFAENSASNKTQTHDHIKGILREVGLENRMHHKPSELSGGQKQRACIARALVMNPAVVLADEPTGNLDTKTGQEILELFQKLHRSKGVMFIIATHDGEIAKHTTKTVHIIDGAIQK